MHNFLVVPVLVRQSTQDYLGARKSYSSQLYLKMLSSVAKCHLQKVKRVAERREHRSLHSSRKVRAFVGVI